MHRTPEQQSWIISIACHLLVILVLSVSWTSSQPQSPEPYPVISVQLVQPPKPKVASKRLVSKSPTPKAVVAKNQPHFLEIVRNPLHLDHFSQCIPKSVEQ